jgi:hypothetical protein
MQAKHLSEPDRRSEPNDQLGRLPSRCGRELQILRIEHDGLQGKWDTLSLYMHLERTRRR